MASTEPALGLTWDRALAWRMRRHHLNPVDGGGAVEIVRRLAGVQAQVASAGELAVLVRQATPDLTCVKEALADRSLIRTWAMRGTLHLLPADVAGAYLARLAAARSWEKGSWQRTFLTLDQMAALRDGVEAALAPGDPLTREELIGAVRASTGSDDLRQHLASGWSTVLKPLAWQGLLCQGPTQGNRITFVRPDAWAPTWSGMPEPDAAARTAIPAYLSAHGPATPAVFDQWLSRGATPKATLRRWFADLGDELSVVDVEGTTAYVRTEDLQNLARAEPAPVRLLPAFDQYVLAPGTGDTHLIAPERHLAVSRAAGWIAPVVVSSGRVAGTWAQEKDMVAVDLFSEGPAVSSAELEAEVRRLAGVLDGEPRLVVRTV